MAQRLEEAVFAHGRKTVMRGEHDVPAGVAGEHFGQHLLVAFVGGVTHARSELRLEAGDGLGRHVGRPVIDVQPRAGIARASGEPGDGQQKRAAVHVSRTRSEMRIRMPNSTVTMEEMALMTGLAPRRAMA